MAAVAAIASVKAAKPRAIAVNRAKLPWPASQRTIKPKRLLPATRIRTDRRAAVVAAVADAAGADAVRVETVAIDDAPIVEPMSASEAPAADDQPAEEAKPKTRRRPKARQAAEDLGTASAPVEQPAEAAVRARREAQAP